MNFMHENGVSYSLPKEIPQLNINHIQKRLQHVTDLKGRQIDNIIFTDESYVQLFRNKIGNWHFTEDKNFAPKP